MLWYSLEAPQRGISNKYHNICFCQDIRKILSGYPLLLKAMIKVKINKYGKCPKILYAKVAIKMAYANSEGAV